MWFLLRGRRLWGSGRMSEFSWFIHAMDARVELIGCGLV